MCFFEKNTVSLYSLITHKIIIMTTLTSNKKNRATTVGTQPFDPETMFVNSKGEIKRLSKFGIWRRKNPEGIFIVKDPKAIYK